MYWPTVDNHMDAVILCCVWDPDPPCATELHIKSQLSLASEEVPEVCTVRFNRAVTLSVSSKYLVQWRFLKNVRLSLNSTVLTELFSFHAAWMGPLCSNWPSDSLCLNNNKCKVNVLDEIYTSTENNPCTSTWSNCLAVGFCWEVHGWINTRVTFISKLFRVSSGSLNTVSHFLELSSGCAGFVPFWKAYAAVSYRESTATSCFLSVHGYFLEFSVSPSHLICVHLPTRTRNMYNVWQTGGCVLCRANTCLLIRHISVCILVKLMCRYF